MSYDSRLDTKKHINQVIEEGVRFTSRLRSISSNLTTTSLGMLDRFIVVFQRQIAKHDASKLVSPEKDGFDKYTPMLAKMEYGSSEYKKCLTELQHPYLDHHYANNSHHPEHYKNGINGMNLFDVIEMLCDWRAAVKRNKKKQVNFDEELLIIFFSILQHMKETYGFPVKINVNFELIRGKKFERYINGYGKTRLKQIKYKYFSDKALELWDFLCILRFFSFSESPSSGFQRSLPLPALICLFSSLVFLCFGASTKVASIILPSLNESPLLSRKVRNSSNRRSKMPSSASLFLHAQTVFSSGTSATV